MVCSGHGSGSPVTCQSPAPLPQATQPITRPISGPLPVSKLLPRAGEASLLLLPYVSQEALGGPWCCISRQQNDCSVEMSMFLFCLEPSMTPGCPLGKVKLSTDISLPYVSVGLTLGPSVLLWVSGRCTLEFFLYQPLHRLF